MRHFTEESSLHLAGVDCGVVHSVTGGGVRAEVLEPAIGPEDVARKRLGAVGYDEFAVEFDLSLDRAVYAWIGQSMTGTPRRVDGALVTVNQRTSSLSRREFREALLTEVTFPALDGASRETAYLTVRFVPELVQSVPVPGGSAPGRRPAPKGRSWNRAGFRLEIDGLDCTRVSRIDALPVRQVVVPAGGEVRDPVTTASRLVFPDLRLSFARSSAPTWNDWAEDFLIRGNNGEAGERSGTLTYLAPDRRRVLGRLTFDNLGIFRLGPEPRSGPGTPVDGLTAELYCQRMEFTCPA